MAPIESRTNGPEPLRAWQRRVLVSALVLLLPAVILAGVWRLGGVSALEDDLIYYLPVRQYIGERIAAGQWPLWNPLTRMGTSIAADPQNGLWYPPTWLFAVLPPLVAYPISIILHFALAGAGMYRFLRALDRQWQAALFGAIAFEFSGYLVAHRAHLTIHHAAAWLPLILYAWQRFSTTGRCKYFALAVLTLCMQMLVQHVQVTVISLAVLAGYLLVVLRRQRPRLIWEFPAGVALGVLLASIQLVPTLLHLSTSGRAAPSYSLFVENSWVPTSSLLLLFPMLFGTRTPNVWDQSWWGLSHFCEQSAYGTIVILLLAFASLWLVRGHQRPSGRLASVHANGSELQRASLRPWNREILFWWIASFIVLLLALGEFTPLSRLLFHIPIYRSLRVPARWILGWSVAMPVLASAVISAVLSSQEYAEKAASGIRFAVKRVLPITMALSLLVMLLARWQVGYLEAAFAGRWNVDVFFEGLRTAIRPGNPAIWWPIVLAAATGYLLLRWTNRVHAHQLPLLFVVMLIDIASIAAFIDVDVETYTRADLQTPSQLARTLADARPQTGQRLLVPRFSADYSRPLEVLWPQSNLLHRIPTLHGYGPFWPLANRLLLRFMPWGSSEEMLAILRNTRLLQSLGVRYVAVCSKQERGLMEAALWPSLAAPVLSPIEGTDSPNPVRAGADVLWPIQIPAVGIYELAFDAQPSTDASERWFVRLETRDKRQIERTRTLTPEDLAAGPRRMRFQFRCDQAFGAVRVRVQAERGQPLSVSHAVLGLVAAPAPETQANSPPPIGGTRSPWAFSAEVEGGISLYELRDANSLFFWADRTTTVASLIEAVDAQLAQPGPLTSPTHVVVEGPVEPTMPIPTGSSASLSWRQRADHEIEVSTDNPAPAFLVFNETYDTGWTATTDGRPARQIRVNGVVQGTVIPPGRHSVLWRYRPEGLDLGLKLTLLGFGILAMTVIASARRQSVRRA